MWPRARALESARGRPIIDLGIGEPDSKTPDHVKTAAIGAIHSDETRYTVVAGTSALRSSICGMLKRDAALDNAPEDSIVSGGANQVIFNAFKASLSKGDEVIVHTPYWSFCPDIGGHRRWPARHRGLPAERWISADAGTA